MRPHIQKAHPIWGIHPSPRKMKKNVEHKSHGKNPKFKPCSNHPQISRVSWDAPMNSMLAHKWPMQTSSRRKTPVILSGGGFLEPALSSGRRPQQRGMDFHALVGEP